MAFRPSVRWGILLSVSFGLVVTGFGGTGVADHADTMTIDVPSEATAGESVTISATIHTKDRYGDYEKEGTVRLYIDGEQVQSQTVTIRDGDTQMISFTVSFESAREHTVTVEGEATFGGYTYSEQQSATIEVTNPPTSSATPFQPTPTVVQPGQEFVGAALPVPDSLRDDIHPYRQQVDIADPTVFLLITESGAYVVFARKPVPPGRATVTGQVVAQDAIQVDGLQLGVIGASDVTVDTSPERVSVGDLQAQPETHAHQLVRVTAQHQQATMLYDPDDGSEITLPQTVGVLGSDAAGGLETNLTQNAVLAAGNASALGARVQAADGPVTVGFQPGYWVNAEQTVDALVFPPDSPGSRYVNAIGNGTVEADRPVLYRVNATFTAQSADIDAVASTPSDYEGELIRVSGSSALAHFSTQETLHHSTPCGDTMVPVMEACVPLVTDVLLHVGGAWGDEPQTVLPVIAASNHHQDTPAETDAGQYVYTGTVRTVQLSNESDPVPVFIAYDITRVGELTGPIPEEATTVRAALQQNVTTGLGTHADTAGAAAVTAGVATESAPTDADSTASPTEAGATTGAGTTNTGASPSPTESQQTTGSASGFGIGIALIAVTLSVAWWRKTAWNA